MEALSTELVKTPAGITEGKFWSEKNKEILELRIRGLGYKRIADQMEMAVNSVRRVVNHPTFQTALTYLTDARRLIDTDVRISFYLEAMDGIKNEIKRRIAEKDLKRSSLKELRETFLEFSERVERLSPREGLEEKKPKGILLREILTKEMKIDGEPTMEDLREIAKKIMRKRETGS